MNRRFTWSNKPADDGVYEVVDVFENERVGMVVRVFIEDERRNYMVQYVEKVQDYDMI